MPGGAVVVVVVEAVEVVEVELVVVLVGRPGGSGSHPVDTTAPAPPSRRGPRPLPSAPRTLIAVASASRTTSSQPVFGRPQRPLASNVFSIRSSWMRSQTRTPMTAPTRGNSTNAQSWLTASQPEKMAVPKLRAGLTEVLSTGIVARWTIANAKPAASPPKPAGYPTVV